jgi:hypothetical protein
MTFQRCRGLDGAVAYSRVRARGVGPGPVGGITQLAMIIQHDLDVVDDLGMLPVGQDAAVAVDRIVDAASKRRSLAVTSNIHSQVRVVSTRG